MPNFDQVQENRGRLTECRTQSIVKPTVVRRYYLLWLRPSYSWSPWIVGRRVVSIGYDRWQHLLLHPRSQWCLLRVNAPQCVLSYTLCFASSCTSTLWHPVYSAQTGLNVGRCSTCLVFSTPDYHNVLQGCKLPHANSLYNSVCRLMLV